jgi:hypothetical protein
MEELKNTPPNLENHNLETIKQKMEDQKATYKHKV